MFSDDIYIQTRVSPGSLTGAGGEASQYQAAPAGGDLHHQTGSTSAGGMSAGEGEAVHGGARGPGRT